MQCSQLQQIEVSQDVYSSVHIITETEEALKLQCKCTSDNLQEENIRYRRSDPLEIGVSFPVVANNLPEMSRPRDTTSL